MVQFCLHGHLSLVMPVCVWVWVCMRPPDARFLNLFASFESNQPITHAPVRESACEGECVCECVQKREREWARTAKTHRKSQGEWNLRRSETHTHTHAYARTQRESEMCVCVGSSCKRCPWGRFNSHLSQVGNATPKAQRESFYLGPLLPCWADESIIGTDQLLLS